MLRLEFDFGLKLEGKNEASKKGKPMSQVKASLMWLKLQA